MDRYTPVMEFPKWIWDEFQDSIPSRQEPSVQRQGSPGKKTNSSLYASRNEVTDHSVAKRYKLYMNKLRPMARMNTMPYPVYSGKDSRCSSMPRGQCRIT